MFATDQRSVILEEENKIDMEAEEQKERDLDDEFNNSNSHSGFANNPNEQSQSMSLTSPVFIAEASNTGLVQQANAGKNSKTGKQKSL